MNNKEISIAVMVVSCDNYSDLWEPFFELFRRFWPDCSLPVYLISNQKLCPSQGVTTIPVGDDVSWSDNLRAGLQQIPEEYVLMWIDDLFLLERVNNDELTRVCRAFIELDGNQIRLNPTVKADAPCNDLFGLASPGTIYRASTVMSLWRKDTLYDLLKPKENAWEFEINGTIRSDAYGGFYAAWRSNFTVVNGVIKGKWRRSAYKKISVLCPDFDSGKRRVMTLFEEANLTVKMVRSKLLSFVPAKHRRKIKDFILSGRYNYRLADDAVKK